MRLIDADIIIKDLTAMKSMYDAISLDGMIKALKEAPTVERPRGEWIMHDDEILGLSCECSACHIETLGNPKFCPECGADMRGEGE